MKHLIKAVSYRVRNDADIVWQSDIKNDEVLVRFDAPRDAEFAQEVITTALSNFGNMPIMMSPKDLSRLEDTIRGLMSTPLRGIHFKLYEDGTVRADSWVFAQGRVPPEMLHRERNIIESIANTIGAEVPKDNYEEKVMEPEDENTPTRLQKARSAAKETGGDAKDAIMEGLEEAAVMAGSEGFVNIVKEAFSDSSIFRAFLETEKGEQTALLMSGLVMHWAATAGLVPESGANQVKRVTKVMMRNSTRTFALPQFRWAKDMAFKMVKHAISLKVPSTPEEMMSLAYEEPADASEFEVEERETEKVPAK